MPEKHLRKWASKLNSFFVIIYFRTPSLVHTYRRRLFIVNNKQKEKTMRYFEVFLELINHGKTVGRTCIQLESSSQFSAAMEAETIVNGRYGDSIYSHAVKVTPISVDEFIFGSCMAA